jgi:uncharacterized integral membrane protein (TIGR00698 family)
MEGKTGFAEKGRSLLSRNITVRELLFTVLLILCASSVIPPPVALLLGIIAAQFIGHPFLQINHKITHILLQVSVVGLGFGMDLNASLEAGRQGFVFSIVSVAGTLVLGCIIGKLLKVDQKISHLIAAGTAICGGSAIAAVSPAIKAEEKQVSVALGTIFILNSIALFLFPVIGHLLHLSQEEFGIWSAVAIQDTSSVAGAAGRYGDQALGIATTVKLTRALWIIPVALLSSWIFKSDSRKIRIPWFIGLFIIAVVMNTYVPLIHHAGTYIVSLSKAGLTVTLFLIGSGMTVQLLKSVGFRPVLQGAVLWVILSGAALVAVILTVRE